MKLKVGAKLMLVPFTNIYKNPLGPDRKLPCTVVYINRPHRFFTVQFDFLYGSFRESYKFYEKGDLCGEPEREYDCPARGSGKHDFNTRW